jgi:predicted transcriptional regulator
MLINICFKIDEEEDGQLDIIAKEFDRSKSWLIRKAIRNYLAQIAEEGKINKDNKQLRLLV